MSAAAPLTPDDAALAAEYVLGLLDAGERAEFEARLRSDPLLWGEVQAWHERLAVLAADVDVAPPARVWRRVEARLFGISTRGLRLWQGLGVGGLGLAAALAVVLFFAPPPPAPPAGPVYAAEIVAEDQSLRLLAVYEAGAGVLRLTRTDGAARAGRALELWVIAGDQPPRSLGVLPEAGTAQLEVPETLRAAVAAGVLAISDEPPGGSPTGAPTGDVLAVGPVTAL